MHTRLNKAQPLRRRYGLSLSESTTRREEEGCGTSPTEGSARSMPEQEYVPPSPKGDAAEQGVEPTRARQASLRFCRHGVSAGKSGARGVSRDGTETGGRSWRVAGGPRVRGPPPVTKEGGRDVGASRPRTLPIEPTVRRTQKGGGVLLKDSNLNRDGMGLSPSKLDKAQPNDAREYASGYS